MKQTFFSVVFFSLSLLCTSCCRIPDLNGYRMGNVVYSRTGYCMNWQRKNPFPQEEITRSFLEGQLTLDGAIQVALLNSPRIQSLYEDVGVAQGEWINTCLMNNPFFVASVRFPDRNTPYWKTDWDYLQPVIRFLTFKKRKQMALSEYKIIQADVTDSFFSFIEEVSLAFLNLQALEQKLASYEFLLELSELDFLAAKKQYTTGNVNTLLKNQKFAEWQGLRLEIQSMLMERISMKEKLAKLLGIPASCYTVSQAQLSIEDECFTKGELCAYAFTHRYDLQALQWKMEKLCKKHGLLQWWTYTDAALGIAFEKDPGGDQEIGPIIALELPIFNYGQGDRHIVQAELQKTYDEFCEKRLEIIETVNKSYENLHFVKKKIAILQDEIVPNQQEITEETIRLYNFMNAGVYEILASKMGELKNEMMLIDAYRDYWTLKVELRRALGGGFPQ